MSHPLQIPLGVNLGLPLQIRGYFYSPWHFPTETTQGWQCSGWALSWGSSGGPLPPRAASLSQESCCWCRSHRGSSAPGTSLPALSPGRQFRMWEIHHLLGSADTVTHKMPPSPSPSPPECVSLSLEVLSGPKITSKGYLSKYLLLLFGGWWRTQPNHSKEGTERVIPASWQCSENIWSLLSPFSPLRAYIPVGWNSQ